ncbi:MAG TPA: hypothetical protein VF402_04560 [Asticcacaulis sp.]
MNMRVFLLTIISAASLLAGAASARDYTYRPEDAKLADVHYQPHRYGKVVYERAARSDPPPATPSLRLPDPPLLASRRMAGKSVDGGSYQCVDRKCSCAIFVRDHTQRDNLMRGY